MSAIDRRPVGLFSALFIVGLVVGLAQLVSDADQTSSGASVAVANAVHVALALACAAALAAAYRRDRRRLRAFLLRPFTGAGWWSFVAALLAPALLITELALLLAGRTRPIARAERRRQRRLVGATPREEEHWSLPVATRRVLGSAPLRLLQFAAAVVMLSMTLRAGQQVFAAFDPDFTRDAWGGPSYLGASFAHWLDGVLLFYGCAVVIGWKAARTSEPATARGPDAPLTGAPAPS